MEIALDTPESLAIKQLLFDAIVLLKLVSVSNRLL